MTVPTSGLPPHYQQYQIMNTQVAGLLQSQTTPYGICGGQTVYNFNVCHPRCVCKLIRGVSVVKQHNLLILGSCDRASLL